MSLFLNRWGRRKRGYRSSC